MVSVCGIGKCRGQIAIEYMVMSAFLLLVVGVLFVYSYSQYDRSMKLDTTQHAVDSLAEASNQAYALGSGSVLFVEIDLPYGIEGYSVDQNHIIFLLNWIGSKEQIYARTIADMNTLSVLPTYASRHRMKVSMGENVVTLQEA